MKNNKFKYALSVMLTMLMGTPALFAQETSSGPAFWDNTFGLMLIVGAAIVIIAAFVTVLRMFYSLMNLQKRQYLKDAGIEVSEIDKQLKDERASNQILKNLTAAVPLEQEKDILLDHDYDGIKELEYGNLEKGEQLIKQALKFDINNVWLFVHLLNHQK